MSWGQSIEAIGPGTLRVRCSSRACGHVAVALCRMSYQCGASPATRQDAYCLEHTARFADRHGLHCPIDRPATGGPHAATG